MTEAWATRLTDITIRNSKPREKSYKLSDGGGLVLITNPNGSRWWRLRYCYGGREKMLSLGIYPGVSLKDARDKRDADHKVIASGRDPSYERRTERDEREITFEIVAREWLALQRKSLAIVTYRKALWILESLLLPSLGYEYTFTRQFDRSETLPHKIDFDLAAEFSRKEIGGDSKDEGKTAMVKRLAFPEQFNSRRTGVLVCPTIRRLPASKNRVALACPAL